MLSSNASTATPVASSESIEQRINNTATDSKTKALQSNSAAQIHSLGDDGPVAILWDIENCPVPSDVRPEDVAVNLRMALRVNPVINGAVVTFSAYGDFNAIPRRVREGCQRTGVKLVDVPNGRKDAADKAILVDMFLFALDNSPPSSIMLISGDVDFAPALHILGQRGYPIILVIPSGVCVNPALCSAGIFVWDWQSIVRGQGFVPASKSLFSPCLGPSETSGYYRISNYNQNDMKEEEDEKEEEEEAILYRGISRKCYHPSVSRSIGISEPLSCRSSHVQCDDFATWVAPGDIVGLKGQLVRLLELSGGCMPLLRVPSEYQKHFCKPLYVSEYGSLKLVDLFKKMSDAISVDGKGSKRYVYLRNSKANSVTAPFILLKRVNKDKEDIIGEIQNTNSGSTLEDGITLDLNMKEFKNELQEILVSYSYRILIEYFEDIYALRYKKQLDYKKLGVDQLDQVLEKVKDVAVVQEDPATKKKFIEPIY